MAEGSCAAGEHSTATHRKREEDGTAIYLILEADQEMNDLMWMRVTSQKRPLFEEDPELIHILLRNSLLGEKPSEVLVASAICRMPLLHS